MANQSHLVSQILEIQNQRTQEMESEYTYPKNLLRPTEIKDLQKTAYISNISSQIKKYEETNILLGNKIKNPQQLMQSLSYVNHKIKSLNLEIQDLHTLKKIQQKEQIKVENNRLEMSLSEELKLDDKLSYFRLQKEKLELQKLELELENTNLENEIQEKFQKMEGNIHHLQLEFKLNSHLRCSHRNQHLTQIIHFQKEYKHIKKNLQKLQDLLGEKNQEFLDVIEKRKKDYHLLITTHLELLSAHTKFSPENEKIYYNCLQEQKMYEYQTKKIKNKQLQEKQQIRERILQLQMYFQKLKKKEESKRETHQNVLQEIKIIKSTKYQMHQEMELKKLKLRNKIQILEPRISILDSHIEALNQEKQNLKSKIYHTDAIIPAILETHLQIRFKKNTIQQYENQLSTLKTKQNQIVNLYQNEIINNNNKIAKLKKRLVEEQKQQKIISLQKKIFLQRNRLEKQKHIKDNNKKILQELEYLAKIIT